jgi:four helix bundle protein
MEQHLGRYDFQRLEVYKKAMDFAEKIFAVTEKFPQALQYSLGDQLRRAALSMCNNLAEGSQKRGPSKRQFYGYALDSSRECVPMLELALRRTLLDEATYEQLSDACFHIGNMMYRLIAKVS